MTPRDDSKTERLARERERLEQDRTDQQSTERRRDSGFMARVRHFVRREKKLAD